MVKGLNCMPASSQGKFGTHLAGAIKGAARYLLNMDSNNLSSLPARQGTPRKVIIFETDGQPDEVLNGGSTNLTTSGDVGTDRNFYGNGNGKKGCDNFNEVANQVKAAGILVITIGFGDANAAPCERAITSSGQDRTPRAPWVRNYLSAAASVDADGAASDADNTCATTAMRVGRERRRRLLLLRRDGCGARPDLRVGDQRRQHLDQDDPDALIDGLTDEGWP